MKAGVYIRWSTEDQGEGTTLQVQRESCLGYCAQQGWEIHDTYIDDGYSGGNLYRPALDRLRADAAAGRLDVAVVYRLDRLSRNVADATALVEREWKHRIKVRSATEEVQPEVDEGWLNFTFRAAFAEYERRVIRQRTHSGKVRRAQEGRHVTRPPYGYCRGTQKGTLLIVESEAAVVRRLFEKCVHENQGTPTLAKWANDMGFPAPGGGQWSSAGLGKLLQNPLYAGRIVFGAHKTLKHSKEESGPWSATRTPLVDVETDESVIPRIIAPELWTQAQRGLERRRTWVQAMTPRGTSSPHLLTGLIYCPCGARMKVKPNGKAAGNTPGGSAASAAKGGASSRGQYLYYQCSRGRDIEPCAFTPGHVPVGLVEQAVVAEFLNGISAGDIVARIDAYWRQQLTTDAADHSRRLAALQDRHSKLTARLAFVDRQYMDEEITAAEMRRFRAAIETELEAVRPQIRDTEGQIAAASGLNQARREMLQTLNVAREWQSMDDTARKRQILSAFVRKVVAFRHRGGRQVEVVVQWVIPNAAGQVSMEAPRSGRK